MSSRSFLRYHCPSIIRICRFHAHIACTRFRFQHLASWAEYMTSAILQSIPAQWIAASSSGQIHSAAQSLDQVTSVDALFCAHLGSPLAREIAALALAKLDFNSAAVITPLSDATN